MKKYKRRGFLTKHHILPRCRNGSDNPNNIIYLPEFRHQSYHDLFGLRTFSEAIELLKEWDRRARQRH